MQEKEGKGGGVEKEEAEEDGGVPEHHVAVPNNIPLMVLVIYFTQ